MKSEIYQRNFLGEAEITPSDPVVAGSYGCWRLTYLVGRCGIALGGGIEVGTDSDSDWGEPQFQSPKEADYITVKTSGRAVLSTVVEGGYISRRLRILVNKQALEEGDEIVITYGDRSFGGPGSRAQTFAEETRYFRIFVDPSGDGRFYEIVNPPYLRVVGGPAVRLSIIAPSQAVVGDPFSIVVRALDRFGNNSYEYDGVVRFVSVKGSPLLMPEEYVFKLEEHGVHRLDGFTPSKPGVYRILARDSLNGISGVSNPILCLSKPSDYNLFWGDLHGQVKHVEKISEYFRFARDVSALDFASHQRNDNEVSKSDWEETKRIVKKFNVASDFVVFLGYEWSGETSVGGDHNIYYLEDDQPIRRSGHEMVEDESDVNTDLTHIRDVYREFREKAVLIIPHVGGRPANLSFHDPALEPVIEVHSSHGTFEWFLREALDRGYKVGFIAGSDDYKLRLGGAYPGIDDRRFVRGGLAAIYARELTRESLFEGLYARRCYGTTGERIILNIFADGHMMGEEYDAETPPKISVQVIGTNHLEKIELFRGLEKIYEPKVQSSKSKPSRRVKISWGGASFRGSYSGVMWDGELRVKRRRITSPVFMPLDRGDEYFSEVCNKGFKWRTFTCGDEDGVSFKVEGEEAEIIMRCNSTPIISGRVGTGRRICKAASQVDRASFSFRVKDLELEDKVFYIGPEERRVRVRRLPEKCASMELSFTFIDSSFKLGVNAYWIRVVQSDGEMAWSSPIYATRSQ